MTERIYTNWGNGMNYFSQNQFDKKDEIYKLKTGESLKTRRNNFGNPNETRVTRKRDPWSGQEFFEIEENSSYEGNQIPEGF